MTATLALSLSLALAFSVAHRTAAAQPSVARDSATVCVRDARTRRPIDAQAVDSAGRALHLPLECNTIPAGVWRIRRLGRRSSDFLPFAAGSRSVVALAADAPVATTIERVEVRAERAERLSSAAEWVRTGATVRTDVARERGAGSVAALVGALPYVSLRSARGETGLSLRGTRREQSALTFDGLPLNDPATGVADVGEIPLVAIEAASVTLGADPIGVGSGAIGGVVALHSAAHNAAALRAGAFGERSAEASVRGIVGNRMLYAAFGVRDAANDFEFVNDAGAGPPTVERRVNNDERRYGAMLGVSGARTQSLLVVSDAERGMVGAANVRTYDADRAVTRRALLRNRTALGSAMLVSGARVFTLDYRDPTRPVLDYDARAGAFDVEVQGDWIRGEGATDLGWRVGVGGDVMRASSGVRQQRGRAFVALGTPRRVIRGVATTVGGRVDLIDRAGVLPGFSLGVERSLIAASSPSSPRSLALFARAAQAVRVPTLYDLYFSSPQRVVARALRPERTVFDGELGVRAAGTVARSTLEASVAAIARETRDAIVWFPGNFTWSPDNVGRERVRGVEARAVVRHARLDLSVWGSQYRSVLRTGPLTIPTPYVPELAAGGQLALRAVGFIASGTSRVMGPRPYTAGPRNPAFELPAVALLDVALSRRQRIRRADLLLVLGIDNVTNRTWQSVRGFPSPGRGWAVSFTLAPRAP